MHIKIFSFNTFMVNCYVLYDETGEAVIIDASCYDSNEQKRLSDFIDQNNLKVVRNLNTHCHIDHILGNAYIERRYGILPEYHKASLPFFITAGEMAASFGYNLEGIPEPAGYLEENDVIIFGTQELKVIYTPGHADGHICLYSEKEAVLFTGDVLFRDTIGRTDLPTGNLELLMSSIRLKLFTLPQETTVYPGHGPETNIGYEIRNNPFIR